MILTVTPNAALDLTFHVPTLTPGGLARASARRTQAGGKGVNVARILHALGIPVRALVVVGGETGQRVVADLEAAGIETLRLMAPGESRICLELVEHASARTTQVHERGVEGSPTLAQRLVAATREAARDCTWVALCGSLPPGLPADAAGQLVAALRRDGRKVAVDTGGAALAAAWAADPELVRVNRDEVAEALACPRDTLPDPPFPALGSAAWCVVSDGAGPVCAVSSDGSALRAQPPPVRLRNPIGCGDAMLAGLLSGLLEELEPRAALRRGVALAAADAESDCAGRPDLGRARALETDVRFDA